MLARKKQPTNHALLAYEAKSIVQAYWIHNNNVTLYQKVKRYSNISVVYTNMFSVQHTRVMKAQHYWNAIHDLNVKILFYLQYT